MTLMPCRRSTSAPPADQHRRNPPLPIRNDFGPLPHGPLTALFTRLVCNKSFTAFILQSIFTQQACILCVLQTRS